MNESDFCSRHDVCHDQPHDGGDKFEKQFIRFHHIAPYYRLIIPHLLPSLEREAFSEDPFELSTDESFRWDEHKIAQEGDFFHVIAFPNHPTKTQYAGGGGRCQFPELTFFQKALACRVRVTIKILILMIIFRISSLSFFCPLLDLLIQMPDFS